MLPLTRKIQSNSYQNTEQYVLYFLEALRKKMSCPPGIVYSSEKYGFKNKYKLDISTKIDLCHQNRFTEINTKENFF